MVEHFERHISAWMDGTEGLSDGEYRAYDVVCNLIYLNDGPIVVNERGFAGRCNQHLLAFRKHFQALVTKRKLIVAADGKVSNRRVEAELRKRKPAPQTLSQPPANPQRTPDQPPEGLARKSLENIDPRFQGGSEGKNATLSLPLGVSDSKEGKISTKKKNLSTLPGDWQPTVADLDYGAEHGFDRKRTYEIAGAFADFHRSKGNRMADWSAAWRTWVRNEVKFNRGGPTHGGPGPDRSATTAAGKLVEGIRGGALTLSDTPRSPSSVRRESEAAPRLLPPQRR
jgi:uncharacterized protein DUF1376